MGLKLHELPGDPGKKQKRKRVGRGEGSGLGKTCGRGHKGAQARAGAAKGGAFEGGQTPLLRRIPKFGFSNVRFRTPRAEITLRQLDRFDEGSTIDLDALKKAGIARKGDQKAKVIATGTLSKKLTVRCSGFSRGAKAAIEAAGGSAEIVS